MSTSLSKAVGSPVKFKGQSGREYKFRRIGLDTWSEFCDWISEERRRDIGSLVIDDTAKASLFKDLVYSGVDTDDMLSHASTMKGMVWLVCRCCSDDVTSDELSIDLSMSKVAGLFRKLADMPQDDDSSGNVEAVGSQSTGTS
tara:strand:+ start:1326 stop:1754 length:429 start_codon:yes stop_codon:yes gene_type:complete